MCVHALTAVHTDTPQRNFSQQTVNRRITFEWSETLQGIIEREEGRRADDGQKLALTSALPLVNESMLLVLEQLFIRAQPVGRLASRTSHSHLNRVAREKPRPPAIDCFSSSNQLPTLGMLLLVARPRNPNRIRKLINAASVNSYTLQIQKTYSGLVCAFKMVAHQTRGCYEHFRRIKSVIAFYTQKARGGGR